MIEALPFYVNYLFLATTLLTLWFFYRASQSKLAIFIVLAYVALQGIISDTGFYTINNVMPPRFLVLVLPAFLTIIVLLATKKGQAFIDSLNNTWLTYLHTIRIPVELTLYFLFIHKLVPGLMTFEGRNFDIISGLTAPLIAYWGYTQKRLSNKVLLLWNFICLALLLNIVVISVLSAQTPFQQWAFDQPNTGVLHFPFTWLPGFIVPMVLFAHLVNIRALLRKAKS